IMSTASGTLLAPSVTFSENVLRGFLPEMSDKGFLWMTRIVVTLFTAGVCLYALSTEESIHGMVENAYKVTLACAFVPLFAGLYWRRANDLGATLSILFGAAVWLGLEVAAPEAVLPPQFAGFFASVLGMSIGGVVGGESDKHIDVSGHNHLLRADPVTANGRPL
ncbi:MAG: sodium:solute symporter, partial [Rhodocyclaceae bacterium]|nr:sodium:solute symporter [Rhodocyclaceae bacterium]